MGEQTLRQNGLINGLNPDDRLGGTLIGLSSRPIGPSGARRSIRCPDRSSYRSPIGRWAAVFGIGRGLAGFCSGLVRLPCRSAFRRRSYLWGAVPLDMAFVQACGHLPLKLGTNGSRLHSLMRSRRDPSVNA